MSNLSDRYFSKEQLLAIAKEKQIPAKYNDAFLLFVENDIRQMTLEGELDVEELGDAAVDFAKVYFDKYEQELQKGHSEEWAHLYASNGEEHYHAFNDTYLAIKANDAEKAKQELLVHCKAVGADEYYTRHFIYIVESRENYGKDPDVMAARFSAAYMQQLAEGKSELYAHEYALLKCDPEENSETYCTWYAKTYEEILQKGKPEEYARLYAFKLAEIIADKFGPYTGKELAEDEDCIFEMQKIKAYMIAWEYAKANKVEQPNDFIERYEHVYLNAYFDEFRNYSISEEDMEETVLAKVIELHNENLKRKKM